MQRRRVEGIEGTNKKDQKITKWYKCQRRVCLLFLLLLLLLLLFLLLLLLLLLFLLLLLASCELYRACGKRVSVTWMSVSITICGLFIIRFST